MTKAVIVSTARTPLAKSWKGAFNMTHGATLTWREPWRSVLPASTATRSSTSANNPSRARLIIGHRLK